MAGKSLSTLMNETAFAAPQVVAHRLMRMALAGNNPSEHDQAEFYRMGSEKVSAFYESWNAMTWQALRVNQELMMSFWFPWGSKQSSVSSSKQLEQAAESILKSGLKPVHQRAVANAKRLGRSGR